MKKVVTMGEMLLRLTPRHYKRLVQADMFRAIFGSGDSFTAGLLCSLLGGKDKNDAVEFAIRASALKYTIKSNYNLSEREEVIDFLRGRYAGRIEW